VLVLGDSFTDGSQVDLDETFTARLQATLDDVAVLNAGVGGYSTVQELLLLEEWLARMVPDLVVVVVYDNDFADNLMPYFGGLGPRPHARVGNGAVELRAADPAVFEPFLQPAPARFWLYRHSAIYRSVQKNLFVPQHGDDLWRREQREREALPLADQRLAMAFVLRRVVAVVRAVGSDALVVAIPTRGEAVAGAAESHEWLAAQCREIGVRFVSLLAALHEAPAAAGYFEDDIHFTREGHERAAQGLAPEVRGMLERRR
jgi:lysophospholipase L1-like esterase